MLKLGEMIKKLRTEKGWTQKQLADELGVVQHTVSQWENGHRVIDLATFQSVLDLLNASLSIERLSLTTAAYRLESSNYVDSELVIGVNPNCIDRSGTEWCEVSLERSGLKLILPEFSFGKGDFSLKEKEQIIMTELGLNYALYEDCPTVVDYFANRGIEAPTKDDFNDFEQLKHDVECSLMFFSPMELASVEY